MTSNHYLVFQIDVILLAIPAQSVVQVIRAVLPKAMPDGPELLTGLLNVRGDQIPLIDVRKQISRPRPELSVNDRIVLASVAGYVVAFTCDHVHTVTELSLEPIESAGAIYPELDHYITAVSRYRQETIFIYNTDKLIPPRKVEEIHQYLQQVEAL